MSSARLGERIRRFREMQNMSPEDLASRVGFAVEVIQAVEADDVSLSLGPLVKLSRALGVRLGTFLDDTVSEDPLIVRKTERKRACELATGKNTPDSLVFFSLGRGKNDRHMEPFIVDILPVPAGQARTSSHEGEEFILVMSGQVEIQYGSKTCLLDPGDSVYYNSVVPHRVTASGEGPAQICAVLYAPN